MDKQTLRAVAIVLNILQLGAMAFMFLKSGLSGAADNGFILILLVLVLAPATALATMLRQ